MKALSTEDDGVLCHSVVAVVLASPHRLEHTHRGSRDPVEAEAHVVSVSVGPVLNNHLSLSVTSGQIFQVLELVYGRGPSSVKLKMF